MFTVLLFAYLLTAVPALMLLSRKKYVFFARVSAIPIILGLYWMVRDHDLFVNSGFMMIMLFAVLVQPLIAVMAGVHTVYSSLFKKKDRGEVLRRIVFNKPYDERD